MDSSLIVLGEKAGHMVKGVGKIILMGATESSLLTASSITINSFISLFFNLRQLLRHSLYLLTLNFDEYSPVVL